MHIFPELFQAHGKCRTKCGLRAAGEVPTENAYEEWVKLQEETYRANGTPLLVGGKPDDAVASSPGSDNLRTAKRKLASNVFGQAQVDSCGT
jgi:hypothetical protein